MTNKYLYITLLAILGFKAEAQGQTGTSTPRLVVSIAIDQLRSDYLEAFAPLYLPDGFKRLLHEGLVFDNASYAFSPVDRASAIASLATGVTPYYNNIVGERWLNRETLRPMNSIDDDRHAGLGTTQTASPAQLATSAIGDELKVATGGKGKVFAIAPYRDAAVLAGGHAADGVFWIDDNSGEWCSSDYYFTELPTWLQALNKLSSPAIVAKDSVWEPINTVVGNFSYFMQTGLQKPFKHTFTGSNCYQQFKASAMVNEAVTEMAKRCIASQVMGIDAVPDLLCLTYYAGNFDHRSVTECQIELQDTYVRLDQELSRLMNHIEQQVGKDRVLFVVTSTGYCDEESTDYEKYHIPTGTFYMNRTAGLMNMYFGAIWGTGKYVDAYFGNQIFLNHKLLETKKISITDATNRAQEFLAMIAGVRNVYTSLQLLTGNNEHLRKIRNGFNAEKSGDILVEPAPGWRLVNEDTQEDQLVRASYVPFPIMILGSGAPAERIKTPVTTDRIAPTSARAIRIRAPNACSAEPLF